MCVDNKEDFQYFLDALTFFHQVQWMYNHPVTKILSERVLDSFPEEWLAVLENLDNEELNNFVACREYQSNWPRSLIHFVEKCKEINCLCNTSASVSPTLPNEFLKGLSPKKQHEIVHLAHLVHQQCQARNISVIVDLGAGLGYVCQLLHHLYNYKVLGLEVNPKNVESARNRQQKFYPDSLHFVHYFCCSISDNSGETIQRYLQETFPDAKQVCLLGLHACGDLSVDMFKIYASMAMAKSLILLSCCYHKLSSYKIDDSDKEYFDNFPVSLVFREALEKTQLDTGKFLRRPFMRLACQESSDRWLGMSKVAHDQHALHVLARAVLELFIEKNELRLERLVQKGTRKSQCMNFDSYLKDSMQRYAFTSTQRSTIPNATDIEENVKHLWSENCSKLKVAELYTALQMLLQSSAESLVLKDRLCWFKERGLSSKIVPVTNRNLSPRCHAIVSWKN